MRPGKLSPELMKKFIFSQLGSKRKEVLVPAKMGEDSSIVDFGKYVCVLSTDPITGAAKDIGKLAVHISCNDIAANGAEPIGVMMTIMFPDGTTESHIEDVTRQIHEAALEVNVEVLGGHTEITNAVTRTVISATSIGMALKDQYITSSGAKPGNDIIFTKRAALEGTAIIAADFEDDLSKKMSPKEIENAKSLMKYISVIPEGKIGAKYGATAMHDATEGGILGAVYELAHASNVGVKLWEDKIPFYDETLKICEIMSLDPFKLIAAGSMLITATDGDKIVDALDNEGIEASIIGKITDEGFNIIHKDGSSSTFEPPERDELWKIL
ncbi:MAG TPA: AIR synthase [Thermoanaerobacterales bacterium]|nr:AIR synthase [Thermoanaerobacterales bacterium]